MTGSLGFSPEYEPTVVGCRGYLKPLRGEGLSEAKTTTSRPMKGKFLFFSFVTVLPFYNPSFHGMMRADPAVAGCDDVV